MTSLRLSALALVLALSAAPLAAAATAPPDPDRPGLSTSERLAALVERVKYEQKQVRSLQARFVQVQKSEMLIAAEESRGVFSYVAPDRVRWEYLSPHPMSVVIAGEEMTTWYRDLDRAEVLSVGRYSEQLFKYLGASGSLDALLDYFRVRVSFPKNPREPYRMELEPRYERIARRLAGMTIWIGRESFLPERVRYVAAGGDVTELAFEALEVNAAIPADRFVLDIPARVERRKVGAGRSSD